MRLILIFILVGIVAFFLAKRKNRNPFIWFLISFLLGRFGPLTILLLVFLPKIERSERCSFCGEISKDNVCKSCGKSIKETIELGKGDYRVK